jgi:RimJ/RimL family protein N-acetyltransferase
MHNAITLELINEQNFNDLVFLLTYDKVLLKSLESEPLSNNNKQFRYIAKWQSENKANSYAIRLGNKSIGLISLSYEKDKQAKVGYWLASSEWNKGYATKAFIQIVKIAKQCGVIKLSASINPLNAASKRIWDNLGANFKVFNNNLIASLEI